MEALLALSLVFLSGAMFADYFRRLLNERSGDERRNHQ